MPEPTRKITAGDLAKLLADRFPGAAVKIDPLPAGVRKLAAQKKAGPHFQVRVAVQKRGLLEVAGAVTISESASPTALDHAMSEIEGQIAAGTEAAENYAAEQRKFKLLQERAGGKREKGEALEAL